MKTPELLAFAPMIALLVWAAALDLRYRRIPNWLTVALIATGLVQSGSTFTALAPAQAWTGLAVGFALTFTLFALGALGGGDVKLFAGIGAWVGPGRVLAIFAAAAVVGMLIVLYQAARQRRIAALFRGSAVILANAANGDLSPPPEPADGPQHEARLPYAVPTLAGAAIVLFLAQSRWL